MIPEDECVGFTSLLPALAPTKPNLYVCGVSFEDVEVPVRGGRLHRRNRHHRLLRSDRRRRHSLVLRHPSRILSHRCPLELAHGISGVSIADLMSGTNNLANPPSRRKPRSKRVGRPKQKKFTLSTSLKHCTDLEANFDRLDLHGAVQVKRKGSRRLKVESIMCLLSVIPSLAAHSFIAGKSPEAKPLSSFIFCFFCSTTFRTPLTKCVFLLAKHITNLVVPVFLISGG